MTRKLHSVEKIAVSLQRVINILLFWLFYLPGYFRQVH